MLRIKNEYPRLFYKMSENIKEAYNVENIAKTGH